MVWSSNTNAWAVSHFFEWQQLIDQVYYSATTGGGSSGGLVNSMMTANPVYELWIENKSDWLRRENCEIGRVRIWKEWKVLYTKICLLRHTNQEKNEPI